MLVTTARRLGTDMRLLCGIECAGRGWHPPAGHQADVGGACSSMPAGYELENRRIFGPSLSTKVDNLVPGMSRLSVHRCARRKRMTKHVFRFVACHGTGCRRLLRIRSHGHYPQGPCRKVMQAAKNRGLHVACNPRRAILSGSSQATESSHLPGSLMFHQQRVPTPRGSSCAFSYQPA